MVCPAKPIPFAHLLRLNVACKEKLIADHFIYSVSSYFLSALFSPTVAFIKACDCFICLFSPSLPHFFLSLSLSWFLETREITYPVQCVWSK